MHAAIGELDRGEARVAEVIDGDVVVHEWAKQAVLLWFRVRELEIIETGPFEYVDRLPLKRDYRASGVRVRARRRRRGSAATSATVSC